MIFSSKKIPTLVNLVFPEGWKFNYSIEFIPRIGETIEIPVGSNFAERVGRVGRFEVSDVVYKYADQKDGNRKRSPNTIFIHLEILK